MKWNKNSEEHLMKIEFMTYSLAHLLKCKYCSTSVNRNHIITPEMLSFLVRVCRGISAANAIYIRDVHFIWIRKLEKLKYFPRTRFTRRKTNNERKNTPHTQMFLNWKINKWNLRNKYDCLTSIVFTFVPLYRTFEEYSVIVSVSLGWSWQKNNFPSIIFDEVWCF